MKEELPLCPWAIIETLTFRDTEYIKYWMKSIWRWEKNRLKFWWQLQLKQGKKRFIYGRLENHIRTGSMKNIHVGTSIHFWKTPIVTDAILELWSDRSKTLMFLRKVNNRSRLTIREMFPATVIIISAVNA